MAKIVDDMWEIDELLDVLNLDIEKKLYMVPTYTKCVKVAFTFYFLCTP